MSSISPLSQLAWSAGEIGLPIGAGTFVRYVTQASLQIPHLRALVGLTTLVTAGGMAYFRPLSSTEKQNERIYNAVEVVGLSLLSSAAPGYLGWALLGAGAFTLGREMWLNKKSFEEAAINTALVSAVTAASLLGARSLGRVIASRIGSLHPMYMVPGTPSSPISTFGNFRREVVEGVPVYAVDRSQPKGTAILLSSAYTHGPASFGHLSQQLVDEGYNVRVVVFPGMDGVPNQIQALKGGHLTSQVLADIWHDRVVKAVSQLVDQDSNRVVLGGLSLGGAGVLDAFIRLPSSLQAKVSHLITLAPAFTFVRADKRGPVVGWLYQNFAIPLATMLRIYNKSTSVVIGEVEPFVLRKRPLAADLAVVHFSAMARKSLRDYRRLENYPKIFLGYGSQDATISRRSIDLVKKVFPRSSDFNYHEYNMGHWLLAEPHSQGVIDDILGFLKS